MFWIGELKLGLPILINSISWFISRKSRFCVILEILMDLIFFWLLRLGIITFSISNNRGEITGESGECLCHRPEIVNSSNSYKSAKKEKSEFVDTMFTIFNFLRFRKYSNSESLIDVINLEPDTWNLKFSIDDGMPSNEFILQKDMSMDFRFFKSAINF